MTLESIGVEFERLSRWRRLLKAAVVDPLANYLPAWLLRGLLHLAKSELAAANWADPGGWRSMVICYDGRPRQIADRVLAGSGTMAMALRNRRRLAAKVLAELITASDREPVHLLCLAAGTGQIEIDALGQARREARATLVDVNGDALDYGRKLAATNGLGERTRFVHGDIRQASRFLGERPDIVTLLGICEYLADEQIVDIARAAAGVMPTGAPIVFNSLSKAHGTDRFFRRVFGLHMNHRTPEQLAALLGTAGFAGGQIVIPEPLGVYHIGVMRRRAWGREAADFA